MTKTRGPIRRSRNLVERGVKTSATLTRQTETIEKSGGKRLSVALVGSLVLGFLLPVFDTSPPRAVATELSCTFQSSTWSGVMAQDVDYHDGNIYVAISSGNMNAPPSHSLKISSDGGSTWSEKTASTGTYTSADVVHIGPAGKIYLGQPWPGSSSTTTSISSDGGNSWSQLSQYATKDVATEGSNVYIASGNGVYVSRNSGSSFTRTSLGSGPWPNSLSAVFALGSNVYVAGRGGLYHSSDSGNSFNHTSLTGTAEGVYAPVHAVTATTSGIYAVTGSGVFKSVDNTLTWQAASDGVGANPRAIAADGDNVYVGSSSGLHVSTNAGGSYSTMTTADGLADNSVRSLALNGSSVYATHSWHTGSWNGGFSVAHNCPSSGSAPSQVTGVSATPGDSEVALSWTAPEDGGVAITDYVIETSFDDGGTWVTVTDGVSTATTSTISSLANGTSVLFRVAAVNSVGSGTASDAVSATPQATVTFDSNLGSGDMSSQSAASLTALTSNSFTRQSYSFNGWNTVADGSGTAYADGASYAFVDSATLYAQWDAVRAPSSSSDGDGPASSATPAVPSPVESPPLSRGRLFVRETDPVESQPSATPAQVPRRSTISGATSAPVAMVGGKEQPVRAEVTGTRSASFVVGRVSVEVGVSEGRGEVGSQSGMPAVKVARDAPATVRGAGLRPNSVIKVFLPAGDGSFMELPSVEVRDDGSFEGSLSFGPSSDGKPMPIGTRYLQMAGIDEDGNNTVLDMPVTVAQPPSGPELDRRTGERPALEPGKSMVLNAGEPEDAAFSRTADGVTIGGDSWAFSVRASSAGDAEDESLAFTRDMPVSFTGSGFMPGTRADVWLFSDPILLGSVNIADDGSFRADFAVDSNFVPTGDHTLQIQGVGDDGFVRAAHLGVVVEDPAAVPVAPIPGSPLNWTPIWLITGAAVLAMLLLFAITASLRGRQAPARVVRPAF